MESQDCDPLHEGECKKYRLGVFCLALVLGEHYSALGKAPVECARL